MRRAVACALAAVCAACGAREADPLPQWTVSISTDAPVPQLGDRLFVEVLDEEGRSACESCRRQLGITTATKWPITFGIAPPVPNRALHVRARLYRSIETGADGLPAGRLLIDALGILPPLAQGARSVGLELRMRCYAQPIDRATKTTCDHATGEMRPWPVLGDAKAAPPTPGSWPEGVARPCPFEVAPDMACIEGNVFLLGDTRAPFLGINATTTTPQRLVRVSPFAMDRTELTVAAFRALIDAGLVKARPKTRIDDAVCAFHPTDRSNDAASLNCATYAMAEEVCTALGKRLPTEAEWELAAGNGPFETRYPWGEDAQPCTKAIVGRGRSLFELAGSIESSGCRSRDSGPVLDWGPVAGGSALDVTRAGVRDLGGNLAEWVVGGNAGYGSACFSTDVLLIDPICDPKKTLVPTHRMRRGGSWVSIPEQSQSFVRIPSTGEADVGTGFRCVKSE